MNFGWLKPFENVLSTLFMYTKSKNFVGCTEFLVDMNLKYGKISEDYINFCYT